MKRDTIRQKVKVFVSSKCGGQYTIVREAISLLLEETNLASTYIFESEPASSLALVEGYLSELDDSDVVLFLIDNADGVTDAVMKEHNRARVLNKKSIYIFCDESQKKTTELQNELTQTQIVKYYPVHSFSEIVQVAYCSILNDIIKIYRVSGRDKIVNPEQTPHAQDDRISFETSGDSEGQERSENFSQSPCEQLSFAYSGSINYKTLPIGFEHTKRIIENVLSLPNREQLPEKAEIDGILADILSSVVGTSKVDSSWCIRILEQLEPLCSPNVYSIISKRWHAIGMYFEGNLQGCVDELTSIFKLAKDNTSIPDWMVSDILIDLRNQTLMLGRANNAFTISPAQELLDEKSVPVYYPFVDRLAGEITEQSLKEKIKHETKSPYTTFWGTNLSTICDRIVTIFIISAFHGSLTHMLLTRKRITDTLTTFCTIFSDHSLYKQLLKLLVLTENKSEYETFERAYNPGSNFINASDADEIWEVTDTIFIPYSRFRAKLLAWGQLCHYFSEASFQRITDEMVAQIQNWILDKNKIVDLGSSIYLAMQSVSIRVVGNSIAELILLSMDNNILRYMDDIHKVIRNLNFSQLDERFQKEIINRLCSQAKDDAIRGNLNRLPDTMLTLRLNCVTFADQLDFAVKESFPTYYETEYQMETNDDAATTIHHVERYLNIIHTQNEEQGKNGVIHGYSGDAHETIINILNSHRALLVSELVTKIFCAAKETILSPKQTVQAKISAIRMIEQLLSSYEVLDQQLVASTRELIDNPLSLQASVVNLGGELNKNPLALNLLLLKLYIDASATAELLEKIMFVDRSETREIISLQASLRAYITTRGFSSLPKILTSAIIQFASEMSTNKERDICIGAVRILGLANETDYAITCIHRLSVLMDYENEYVKIRILQNIDSYKDNYKDAYDYVLQKGITDNSYLVRLVAQKAATQTDKHAV